MLPKAVVSQVKQWEAPVVKQVKKIEGGAKKHGGIDKAIASQIEQWVDSDSNLQDESNLAGNVVDQL